MPDDNNPETGYTLDQDDKRFIESQINRILTILLLGEVAALQGNSRKAKKFLAATRREVADAVDGITEDGTIFDLAYKEYAEELIDDIFASITVPDAR